MYLSKVFAISAAFAETSAEVVVSVCGQAYKTMNFWGFSSLWLLISCCSGRGEISRSSSRPIKSLPGRVKCFGPHTSCWLTADKRLECL